MPQGIDFTTGDVMTRLREMLGFGPERTRGEGFNIGSEAVARFSRTPVQFTQGRVAPGQTGEFDPNNGSIRVQAGGGRSLREISRSISHEDVHALVDQLVRTLPPKEQAEFNAKATHDLLGGKEKEAFQMLSRVSPNLEEVRRALSAFKAANLLSR